MSLDLSRLNDRIQKLGQLKALVEDPEGALWIQEMFGSVESSPAIESKESVGQEAEEPAVWWAR